MHETNGWRIGYIQLPRHRHREDQLFYYTVFGWKFGDYSPDYASFHDGRL